MAMWLLLGGLALAVVCAFISLVTNNWFVFFGVILGVVMFAIGLALAG